MLTLKMVFEVFFGKRLRLVGNGLGITPIDVGKMQCWILPQERIRLFRSVGVRKFSSLNASYQIRPDAKFWLMRDSVFLLDLVRFRSLISLL